MASSNLSEITHSQTCREHIRRLRNDYKDESPIGKNLWRQMLIGFVCAACLGIMMLILGSVFIGNAIRGNTSITVMLCVLGMVCGLIILVGTAILGRLLLLRKLRMHNGQPAHHRPEACLHGCSSGTVIYIVLYDLASMHHLKTSAIVIYTPSIDQLNRLPYPDLPPSYEMVILEQRYCPSSEDDACVGSIEINNADHIVQPIMISPPKYSVAAVPLPGYGDSV